VKILDSIAGRMGYQKAQAQQTTPGFLMQTANNERWNIPDYGLAENQLTAYQALYAIADAVSIVARYSATTPAQVFELKQEKRETVINHPFELLLNKPNPAQSRFRLLEGTIADTLLAGNAYWWMNKLTEDAEPTELFRLPANRMTVVPGGQIGMVAGYKWDAGLGESIPLEAWEVLHFKEYHPRNMFVGLSRVESIAKETEKDIKAAQYDLNFFGKDNAKPEGILGFKGMVDEDAWAAIKKRWSRDHGGVKREMALARGMEDMKYVQLALNYTDMEFLANRTFTRDLIYNHFAPGLPGILSVNATEANSRTAKATLMEMGIWPLLVSIHEAITNNIMPLYGENFVCQFEDVRLSDKAMELSEVNEYAKTHTINEVREKYYQSPAVEDERGELFVVQLGKISAMTTDATSVTTSIDGDLPDERNAETGGETSDEGETAGQQKALMKAELKQWRRFAGKRIGKKNAKEFVARQLEQSLVGAIEGALELAATKADSNAIFDTVLEWEGYP